MQATLNATPQSYINDMFKVGRSPSKEIILFASMKVL